MRKKSLIIMIFVMCFLLEGCGLSNKTDKERAKEVVISFLDGYKQKDKSVSELLLGKIESDYMSFDGISSNFAERLKYEIKSCQGKDENIYSVEVEIETIDFEKAFNNAYQKTIKKYGEEGIRKNFLNEMKQEIERKECIFKKIDCNVTVRKIKREFKIQIDDVFANALTGGMNKYLFSLQEEG